MTYDESRQTTLCYKKNKANSLSIKISTHSKGKKLICLHSLILLILDSYPISKIIHKFDVMDKFMYYETLKNFGTENI